MKIKCPNCGSSNVICEAEATIRFMFNEKDNIEIISEWDSIIDELFWGTPYRCECQDCDEVFNSE